MPLMSPSGSSRKIAVFLSLVTIVLLVSSFSATWYLVTIRHGTGSPVSHRMGINLGQTTTYPSEYTTYDYSEHPQISDLMGVTGAGVIFAVLLTLALVASCLLDKKRTSISLSGISVVNSIIALMYFALRVPDAVNSNPSWPLQSIPWPIDGFSGSPANWEYAVSYGPGIGWYLLLLAVVAQIAVLLSLMLGDRIDGILKERGERSLWDLEEENGVVVPPRRNHGEENGKGFVWDVLHTQATPFSESRTLPSMDTNSMS
jgi:hypothetical protein